MVPHNRILSDLVLVLETQRQFAASELRAGRLPLWNPHNFTGSPAVGFHSPFDLIYYALPVPILLAWLQLLKSLVAGLGAYVFFRSALQLPFWPRAIGAICYPVTGAFVLWQGYTLSESIAFLPWILIATHHCVCRPKGWGHTDILHARPVLYVMSDDPALGVYQAEFANLLGMLEERTIAGPDKIVSTKKVFHELLEKPNQVIDGKNFARARMFDILMGRRCGSGPRA